MSPEVLTNGLIFSGLLWLLLVVLVAWWMA
jgi:hypothetical protein